MRAKEEPSGEDTLNMSQKSDLTRLLEEADQQLADPENNRRHTSISHLRAAVKSARAKSLLEGMEPRGTRFCALQK